MAKQLNIGIIGYGFMGRAHSNAYRQVPKFFDVDYDIVMKAACARKEDKIKKFASNWGWESTETDWRKLVARDDIDIIDIATPNNLHCEIALEAAKAGKMIFCEKPLAMNAEEGEKMLQAATDAGIATMVWYNYRRVPAIAFAKQIVDENRVGTPFHYRAKYLQDWTISPDVPQGGATLWRLDKDAAGSGVTGDLLAHSIDTAMWLNGPITEVCAMTETFIKERELQDSPGTRKEVKIDDACAFLVRFKNGSIGTFESTRYARGRKNQNTFELNGEKASIYFDLEDAHQIQYYGHDEPGTLQGWRTVLVTDSDHPYMDRWWVPGCVIGYEHTFTHAVADFLAGLKENKKMCPDFKDALATQHVCDAVLASAEEKTWKEIKQPS